MFQTICRCTVTWLDDLLHCNARKQEGRDSLTVKRGNVFRCGGGGRGDKGILFHPSAAARAILCQSPQSVFRNPTWCEVPLTVTYKSLFPVCLQERLRMLTTCAPVGGIMLAEVFFVVSSSLWNSRMKTWDQRAPYCAVIVLMNYLN